MDPEATWLEMLQALIADDREAASEHAKNLIDWLDRGGFPPRVLPDLGQVAHNSESPVHKLDRLIVSIVCARVRIEP